MVDFTAEIEKTASERALRRKKIDFNFEARIPKIFRELFIPARYKGFYGGRGSAKSMTFSIALLCLARTRRTRILCCREIQNTIKDSVKHILEKCIIDLGMQGFFINTREEIIGLNGSKFIFKGLRGDTENIKSYDDIDIAWIEEAQSISDKSLVDLKNTIRKQLPKERCTGMPGDGSEIWASWNPRHASDPIDRFMHQEEGATPDPRLIERYRRWSVVKRVNWDQNPFFPDVLMVEMLRDRERDPGRYRHIWLGEYLTRSEAQVFKNWRVGSPAEIMQARGLSGRFYFGADWGYASDPTVLIRCFILDRTLYIDHEAHAHNCDLDYLPALFAGDDFELPPRWSNPQKFHGVPQALRWPITADSARPETIAYMNRRGFHVVPSAKGAGSVQDGIEFLKNYDIVVHPNCTNTIEELTTYSYRIDRQTQEILPVVEDRHNHCLDAARYACEALRRSTYDSSLQWVGDDGAYGNVVGMMGRRVR